MTSPRLGLVSFAVVAIVLAGRLAVTAIPGFPLQGPLLWMALVWVSLGLVVAILAALPWTFTNPVLPSARVFFTWRYAPEEWAAFATWLRDSAWAGAGCLALTLPAMVVPVAAVAWERSGDGDPVVIGVLLVGLAPFWLLLPALMLRGSLRSRWVRSLAPEVRVAEGASGLEIQYGGEGWPLTFGAIYPQVVELAEVDTAGAGPVLHVKVRNGLKNRFAAHRAYRLPVPAAQVDEAREVADWLREGRRGPRPPGSGLAGLRFEERFGKSLEELLGDEERSR